MKKILIDTDVILDFFFDRLPFSEYSARLLSLCETGNLKGYVTPVICSNLYYLLRKAAKHEKVIAKISLLLSYIEVIKMDNETVVQALNSGFHDFEDALQNSAAMESGFIEAIITRNCKDFSNSDLGVMTPETFLKTMEAY